MHEGNQLEQKDYWFLPITDLSVKQQMCATIGVILALFWTPNLIKFLVHYFFHSAFMWLFEIKWYLRCWKLKDFPLDYNAFEWQRKVSKQAEIQAKGVVQLETWGGGIWLFAIHSIVSGNLLSAFRVWAIELEWGSQRPISWALCFPHGACGLERERLRWKEMTQMNV